MPFYRDYIYPYLVDRLGDPPPIRKIRERIIPLAEGTVLEIGVGAGANFLHYDATEVNKLYALEPNLGMIRLAQKKMRHTRLNIQYLDLPGEQIPLEDQAIDTVVSTFTLCTIPGIADAIREIARILKPGGILIFFKRCNDKASSDLESGFRFSTRAASSLQARADQGSLVGRR